MTKPMSFGDVPPQSELAPGVILHDRYQLLSSIGRGGMGVVFEAMHVPLQEKRAIKVLGRIDPADGMSAERFLNEARVTVKIKHPNVIDVKDAGVSAEGHRYLAMELLDGETLGDFLERRSDASRDEHFIRTVVGYTRAICAGLASVHAQKVVHSDLKPSNIFLHKEAGTLPPRIVPKLLDFGVALRLDQGASRLFEQGEFFGTTGYAAPERIMGGEPDMRSDIYSMGIILYEALAGCSPFEAKDTAQLMARPIDPGFEPISLCVRNPAVSPELSEICAKALERYPNLRFQTADELAAALKNAPILAAPRSDPATAEVDAVRVDTLPEPQPGRTIGVVLVSVLAVLALVVIWLAPERNPAAVARTSARVPLETAPNASAARSALPGVGPSADEPPLLPTVAKASDSSIPVSKPLSKPGDAVKRALSRAPAERQEEAPAKDQGEKEARAPGLVSELVARGERALDRGEVEEASRLLDEAVRLEPRAARAWFGLGRVAIERGDNGQAAQRIARALKCEERPRWRITLGQVYWSVGKEDDAQREWRTVLNSSAADEPTRKTAERLLARREGQPTSR